MAHLTTREELRDAILILGGIDRVERLPEKGPAELSVDPVKLQPAAATSRDAQSPLG